MFYRRRIKQKYQRHFNDTISTFYRRCINQKYRRHFNNIISTSYRRGFKGYDVAMTFQCIFDVILASCAHWEIAQSDDF